MRFVLLAFVIACTSAASEPEAPPAAVGKPVAKPSPQKPRYERLADQVIAAVASGDVERLRPLYSKLGWAELESMTRDGFRKLQKRLTDEHIDLAKAKIVRVEMVGREIEMVDVVLEHQGRRFLMHFSATSARDGYWLLVVAEWIKWEDSEKP